MKSDGEGEAGFLAGWLAELRRRHVVRVAIVYALAAFGMLQVGDLVAGPLGLPDWTLAFLIVVAALGFPVALVLAWAFEVTPDGVRRAAQAPIGGDAAEARRSAFGPGRGRVAGVFCAGVLVALATVGAYTRWSGGGFDSPASEQEGAHAEDRAIAVLPFENLSAEEENTYFAAGVHEDLLTQLSLVPDLAVISRTSVMQFQDTDRTIPEIAAELGARYVLEGSVRRAGDRVRITAQLIDGRSDEHLWADQYDRGMEDIFAVQSEVATSIARAMDVTLSSEVAARIEARPTGSRTAYDLYLRGRELLSGSGEGIGMAIELFDQAIALDSTFAESYSQLALAYYRRVTLLGYGTEWADSGAVKARRAIALESTSPTAHLHLGYNLELRGRLDEAGEAYRRAVDLRPSYADALAGIANVSRSRGRYAEAIDLFERAEALSPTSWIHPWNLGVTYIMLDDDRAATHWLDRAAERDEVPWVAIGRVWQEFARGDLESAYRLASEALREHPSDILVAQVFGSSALLVGRAAEALPVLGRLYREAPEGRSFGRLRSFRSEYALALHLSGDRAEADILLDLSLERAHARLERGDEWAEIPLEIASIHAVRGEREAALVWLQRAYAAGDRGYRFLEVDPVYRALHGHPEFVELIERMERDVRRMREGLRLRAPYSARSEIIGSTADARRAGT